MNDGRFDTMARAAHAQAIDALGPRVQAQLHQRRSAALAAGAGASPLRGHGHRGWAWVAAPALALVLAFGMPWRTAREPAAAATAAGAQVAATPPVEVQATLDQDPDFYMWLASSDAVALASE